MVGLRGISSRLEGATDWSAMDDGVPAMAISALRVPIKSPIRYARSSLHHPRVAVSVQSVACRHSDRRSQIGAHVSKSQNHFLGLGIAFVLAVALPGAAHGITASELRSIIESGPEEYVDGAFEEAITQGTEEEGAELIFEASYGLPAPVLAWSVFPPAAKYMAEYVDFRTWWVGLVLDPSWDIEYRVVVLDALDRVARRDAGFLTGEYVDAIRFIAAESTEPFEIRGQAVRSLGRDGTTGSDTLLTTIAGDADLPMVEAVAHAVGRRLRNGSPVSSALTDKLLTYCSNQPSDTKDSSSLLHFLASMDSNDAETLLNAAAAAQSDSEGRAMLVSMVGDHVDPETIELYLNDARTGAVPLSGELQESLATHFAENAAAASALFTGAKYEDYLFLLSIAPDADPSNAVGRLTFLTDSSDASLATAARRVVEYQPWSPSLADAYGDLVLPEGMVLPAGWTELDETVLLSPIKLAEARHYSNSEAWTLVKYNQGLGSAPTGSYGGFDSNLNRGDGIYRDLSSSGLVNSNHWHAGLYHGFYPNLGSMNGAHCSNKTGLGDCTRRLYAARNFSAPSAQVISILSDLRHDFIYSIFLDGETSSTFHGAKAPPGRTHSQRNVAVREANRMKSTNIWWTGGDMLDAPSNWNADGRNIDDTRCDGLVEFSIEKASVRLSTGTSQSLWKIATPGTAAFESHNDFHNGTLDDGELCPKVQSGWQGSASTAVPSAEHGLEKVRFEAFDWSFVFPPSIWIRLDSDLYDYVYARLTVSKDGGAEYFVRTEDPFGGQAESGRGAIVADWRFIALSTLRPEDSYAFWLGETVGGPDFAGMAGEYTFTLTAVDSGGNAIKHSIVVDMVP